MHFTYKYLVILLIGMNLLSSCSKFVEVETPKNQILRFEVFEDEKTAESALLGMYAALRTNSPLSGSYSSLLECLAIYGDEADHMSSTISDKYFFYNNQIHSSLSTVNTIWSNAYKLIFQANSIIEGTLASEKLSPEMKNKLIGEASLVRAVLHFYLTNLYGDIPYVKSTNFLETMSQGKISVDNVYTQVIEDLKVADDLLLSVYPTNERVRPNNWVAKAFMARVYLYMGNWEKARDYATAVIHNQSVFSLESDLDKVFLKESKEAIWQFKPATNGGNAAEGVFILVQAPELAGMVVSNEFLDSHEAGDDRFSKWLGVYTYSLGSVYYPFKYKERTVTGTVSKEYSMILRLAEQYLIRAEAYAQLQDVDNALSDLNIIRNRAGLDDFESEDVEEILDAILHERRVELFFEMGHRWFDLKRTGKAEQYLSPIKTNWTTNHLKFPYPIKEIEANKNLLPQNVGYN